MAAKGFVLLPKASLDIDVYPDADFAGFYGYEKVDNPFCTSRKTGFVMITMADCPVLWHSKLQTEMAESTIKE